MDVPELKLSWLDDWPPKPPALEQAAPNVWMIEVLGVRVQIFISDSTQKPTLPIYGFSLWGKYGQLHLEPRHGYDKDEAVAAAMLAVDWINNGKRGPQPYKPKLPTTRQEDYEPDYDDMTPEEILEYEREVELLQDDDEELHSPYDMG